MIPYYSALQFCCKTYHGLPGLLSANSCGWAITGDHLWQIHNNTVILESWLFYKLLRGYIHALGGHSQPGIPLHKGFRTFFESTSLRTLISMAASAYICLNRRFSSSSSFKRRRSCVSMPLIYSSNCKMFACWCRASANINRLACFKFLQCGNDLCLLGKLCSFHFWQF